MLIINVKFKEFKKKIAEENIKQGYDLWIIYQFSLTLSLFFFMIFRLHLKTLGGSIYNHRWVISISAYCTKLSSQHNND